MIHELKIEHEWLDRIRRGLKTCEIRKHDRDFQAGDTLYLRCTCSSGELWTTQVMHVLTHNVFPQGIQPGYCVLSLDNEAGFE